MLFKKEISYRVAKASSTVIRIGLAGVTSYMILHWILNYFAVHLQLLSGIVIAAVSIFIWRITELLFRSVLHPWVRRRYFRDYYDFRAVWSELRSSLKSVLDLNLIAEIVLCKTRETFGTKNAAIFLRDKGSGNFVGFRSNGLEQDFSGRDLTTQLVVPKNTFRVDIIAQEWYPIVIISDDFTSGWQYVGPEEGGEFSSSQSPFLQKLKYLLEIFWILFKRLLGIELSDLRTANRVRKVIFNKIEIDLLKRIQAAAVVVMRDANHIYGFMTLGRREGEMPFSGEDQQLLSSISGTAADAIKSSQGLDAFSDFLRVWERVIKSGNLDEVLNASLSAAVDAIGRAEAGSLFLWDHQLKRLVLRAQKNFSEEIVDVIQLSSGEGYAGWVFESGMPVEIPDVQADERTANLSVNEREKFNSALCVPLEAYGFRMGVLCLDGSSLDSPFDSVDLERLWALAQQSAIAIFNSRLHQELYTLSITINKGGLDAMGVFEAVTQSIFRLTHAQSANMFLLRDPHNALLSLEFDPLVTAKSGLTLGADESIKPRQHGMTHSVIQNGEPCYVRNRHDAPGINPVSRALGVEASVGLPLIVDGLVNGVLFINYHIEHDFTDAEKRSLALFADQAAFALNSARQRSELELTDNVAWMGLLFPSMSHKIIQGTGSIANDVTALRTVLKSRNDIRDYLDGIEGAVENLKRLRREALSLPQENNTVLLEINKTLRSEITRWCGSDPHVRVDFSGLEIKESKVLVDQKRFGLVLEVLAVNAVKAMKDEAERTFFISSRTRLPWIILAFTNPGPPISSDIAKRLFLERIPGSSSVDHGSGVGLLISRRIIRRYGGELELVKSDTSGTTFSIWLPKAG